MQPSKYQQAVFQAFSSLEDGQSIQINAVAGSGKTTTLVLLLKQQPQHLLEQTLFCAFNKEIAKVLEEKAPKGVTVKTIHGVGYAALAAHLGIKLNLESRKYRKIIDHYFLSLGLVGEAAKARYPKFEEAKNALYNLVHFARVTLCLLDRVSILKMSVEYDIDMPESELMLEALPQILTLGNQSPEFGPHKMIDFDDMVYLPCFLDLTPKQYGAVLVDECQDLSSAQLELILRSRKPTGRMVFVGDPFQAIYGFAGANSDSFDRIAARTGAMQLPLSICYRCAGSVIETAQKIVPHIEARPDAPSGTVQTVQETWFTHQVTERDMVLCRVTAPLISMAFWLIRQGKRAKVKGRDIGTQLLKITDEISSSRGVTWENFTDAVWDWNAIQVKLAMKRTDNEALLMNIEDRTESVLAVYEAAKRNGAKTFEALRAYLQDLFADNHERGTVLLSTIHRSKGLEAERVFLLCPEKLPHPMAKSANAKAQEKNLEYVAVTRAMNELYIVETPGTTPTAAAKPEQPLLAFA
jgi:superfamily I DNA/RNA helicase